MTEEKQQEKEDVRRNGWCKCGFCWTDIKENGLMCVECSKKKDQKGCDHFLCSKCIKNVHKGVADIVTGSLTNNSNNE